MKTEVLINKIEDLLVDLKSWEESARSLEEKSKDVDKLLEELKNRENIVEKEIIISRERKLLLDAREKNVENQEARLQKYKV